MEGCRLRYVWSWMAPIVNEHGNDSLFYTAVENEILIAILWHIYGFSN